MHNYIYVFHHQRFDSQTPGTMRIITTRGRPILDLGEAKCDVNPEDDDDAIETHPWRCGTDDDDSITKLRHYEDAKTNRGLRYSYPDECSSTNDDDVPGTVRDATQLVSLSFYFQDNHGSAQWQTWPTINEYFAGIIGIQRHYCRTDSIGIMIKMPLIGRLYKRLMTMLRG